MVYPRGGLARGRKVVTPKQTDPQFKLRLPASLKVAVERAAAENNRSMNAEIVSRLERSLHATPADAVVDLRDNLAALLQRLADGLDRIDGIDTREGYLAAVQARMGVDRKELTKRSEGKPEDRQ